MSRNESEASGEGSAEPQSASVFDFLYCDTRRIGAFLSQFDELGVPTRVSISESVQKARGRAVKLGLSGGIAGIGNAALNFERGPAAIGGQEAEVRDYDPLWTNALALLDYLDANELLSRDLAASRIGQLVLATGNMTMLDLTLFKGLWALPAVREAVTAGQRTPLSATKQVPGRTPSRQQRRAEQRHSSSAGVEKSGHEAGAEAALALVGMLPHAIQVRLSLTPGSHVVWASLRDEAMVVSAADIFLKHGAAVAGSWTMIGILDAFPDINAEGQPTSEGAAAAARLLSLGDSPLGQMLSHLVPLARHLLGRPFAAYGMTPLLIFRKVSS